MAARQLRCISAIARRWILNLLRNVDLDPDRLIASIPFLAGSLVIQKAKNTLTCIVWIGTGRYRCRSSAFQVCRALSILL